MILRCLSCILQVDQAAAGLLALGLKKGDRLGMWGPNKYEWVLMQFATAQAGIILVSAGVCISALGKEMDTAVASGGDEVCSLTLSLLVPSTASC